MVLTGARGVLPIRSRRSWAAGAMELGDGCLTVNLGEDNGPDNVPTENALFLDGQADKLGRVSFKFDHGKPDGIWRIRDGAHRIALEFRPDHADEDKLNLVAGQIYRRRLYGRAGGRVKLSSGQELELTDMPFFAEYADDRW